MPQNKIVTAQNDRNIDVRGLNYVKFWKWEDDNWTEVNLQANYAVNNSQYAEPYMIIPASKGKFHVYLECDGQMAVKSVGGKADNSWRGLIAYDTSRRMWNVGNYKGCVFENYKKTDSFVLGHPDVEVNDCKFDRARGVEADWYASFQLTCDDDEGAWILYAPPIPKDSLYNYTVSYGEYTENMCEWGAVSISIDEDNGSTGNEVRIKPRRGMQMHWAEPEGPLVNKPLEESEVKQDHEKENSFEQTSQRQDYKTHGSVSEISEGGALVPVSWTGSDYGGGDEEYSPPASPPPPIDMIEAYKELDALRPPSPPGREMVSQPLPPRPPSPPATRDRTNLFKGLRKKFNQDKEDLRQLRFDLGKEPERAMTPQDVEKKFAELRARDRAADLQRRIGPSEPSDVDPWKGVRMGGSVSAADTRSRVSQTPSLTPSLGRGTLRGGKR